MEADLDGFGDLGVGPFGTFPTSVRFQEDPGAGDRPGRGLALRDRSLQQEAFSVRKGDDVQLGHEVVLHGEMVGVYRDAQ